MAAYSDNARDQAIAWFNRVQDPALEEAGWIEFTAWLEDDPQHRAAYDAVETIWLGFEALPQADIIPLAPRVRKKPTFAFPYAAAATLAVAVIGLGAASYLSNRPPPVQTYRTAAGEVRSLNLSDGSHITLDRGSTLKVEFERGLRRVELVGGEASFSVVHDAARPFVVAAGDQKIEDIGTEFDVLSQADRLQVTVAHGLVAVGPAAGGASALHLAAGDQFDRRRGRAPVVRRIEPGSASSWRGGVLVYRDAPLGDVAADLGRYLATPVRLAPGTEDLNFSGVLRIADGQSMIDRLQAFLSLDVRRGPEGVLLSRKSPLEPR